MRRAAANARRGQELRQPTTPHDPSPVRIAVVGAGYWGPNLIRCASASAQAELVTVCDLAADRLADVERHYPGVSTTRRFEDVLADEAVEAVVVATPISTHHRLTRAALSAGKHVLVEKPLATSEDDALDLVQLAARSDLVLLPGHTFLYSPAVNIVRELISSGELGEIYAISMSRVNLGIHQSDSSVLWDLAPHDFSILRYWLDDLPSQMTVTGRDCIVEGIPDVAFISMRFASRLIAHVELAWLAPSKLRRTTVIGSRKMATYVDTSNEPVRVFDSGVDEQTPQNFGEFQLSYRVGDILSPRVDAVEPLALELADFCNAIRTGSPLRSRPELGLDVVRMVTMAEESLSTADDAMEFDPDILRPGARAANSRFDDDPGRAPSLPLHNRS